LDSVTVAVFFQTYMRIKQKPLSPDTLKTTKGITFSLELEQVIHVKQITCTSLLHRMNKGIKKRREYHHSQTSGECQWCQCKKTAQWRKGPNGARSLCNRCGIEWAKQVKQESKLRNLNSHDAELLLVDTYRETDRFQRFQREHLGR
jgi:hypothetical protein